MSHYETEMVYTKLCNMRKLWVTFKNSELFRNLFCKIDVGLCQVRIRYRKFLFASELCESDVKKNSDDC